MNELGTTLAAIFERFEKDRNMAELRMLENYRQYRGEYDPDTLKDFGKNRSHAYPKVTRAKCISTVARLMQMLFPASEKNWSLKATPVPNMSKDALRLALQAIQDPNLPDAQIFEAIEKFAKARAAAMEKEMEDQLIELGGTKELPYVNLCKKVIQDATKYGLGILKGPMVRKQMQTRWSKDGQGGFTIDPYEADRPYYENVSPWNYYPDLSAKSFASMDGEFERHPLSRRQLESLTSKSGFNAEAIREFIRAHKNGNFKWRTHETQLRSMGVQEKQLDAAGKFELIEYWGDVEVKPLRDAGVAVDETLRDDDIIQAHVCLLDAVVVNAEVNPYSPYLCPYHHFVFEEDDSSLAGEGLPHIMRDSQLGISAATRMMVDNAAVSAGPIFEVNTGLLIPGQDVQDIHAFKVLERDDDGPSAAVESIREIQVASHVDQLEHVLVMFQGFADMETFITPAMNADMDKTGKEPFRTAQGASLLLAGASLPLRDIVRNYDAFTLSVMTSLVAFNMQFSDKEEIKGDHQVAARGADSLMAKEVRAQTLDMFASTLTDSEIEYVNPKGLLTNRVTVRDLPIDELVLPDSTVEKNRQDRAAQATQAASLQKAMIEAQIKEIVAATIQKLATAKKAGAGADKLLAETIAVAGEDPAGLAQADKTRTEAAMHVHKTAAETAMQAEKHAQDLGIAQAEAAHGLGIAGQQAQADSARADAKNAAEIARIQAQAEAVRTKANGGVEQ